MLLKYDIRVIGAQRVEQALSNVERRFSAHNQRMTRELGTTAGKTGGKGVSASAQQRATDRAAAKAIDQALKDTKKLNDQKEREKKKSEANAAREKLRLDRLTAKETAATTRRVETEKRQAEKRSHNEFRQNSKAIERERRREQLQTIRLRERADKKVEAENAKLKRNAERADRAQQKRQLSLAAKESAASHARYRHAIGLAGNSVKNSVGTAVGYGTMALGIGGGALFAGAAGSAIDNQTKASKLANQAGNPALKSALMAESGTVQGSKSGDVLDALTKWTDVTGKLEDGRAIMQELGQVSLATGTDLADLATAAARAFIPLNDQIKDPTERMKKLREVIRSTAAMGQIGAVEIKDLAVEMGALAAGANRYGGDVSRNLKVAVAMAQTSVQRGGAANAAEASTAVNRFGSDVLSKEKEITGLGVDIFTDKTRTQMRPADQIIGDILTKTKGDLAKHNELFGERGIRAMQGFAPVFTDAERNKKGSGLDAVKAEFARFLKANLSQKDIDRNNRSRMEDPDIQFQEAIKGFNGAVGKDLVPVITKAIGEFSRLTPALSGATKTAMVFANFAIDNPLAGLGAIIAAKVVADIGAAGLSKAIGDAVAKSASMAPITVAGAIAITAAHVAIQTVLNAQSEAQNNEGKRSLGMTNIQNEAAAEYRATGTISEETAGKLKAANAEEIAKRDRARARATKERDIAESGAIAPLATIARTVIGPIAQPLLHYAGLDPGLINKGNEKAFGKAVAGATSLASGLAGDIGIGGDSSKSVAEDKATIQNYEGVIQSVETSNELLKVIAGKLDNVRFSGPTGSRINTSSAPSSPGIKGSGG